MASITTSRSGRFTDISIIRSRDFWEKVGDLFVDDITKGIIEQQDVAGGTLKKNSPGTMAMKRKMGLPLLSLVALQRNLVSRMGYLVQPDDKGVSITARAPYAIEVQKRGYNFFGPRERFRDAFKALILRVLRTGSIDG